MSATKAEDCVKDSASDDRPPPLVGGLADHAGLKLLLFVGLNLWISGPYHAIQRLSTRPATPMPVLGLDRAVPFASEWTWVYLSVFALAPLPAMLMRDRVLLKRLALEMAVIGLVSNAIFVVWPTSVPRPDAAGTTEEWQTLTTIDRPVNACPSLHASLAVFAALWFLPLGRGRAGGTALVAAAWAWALAVLWATLATKQHVVVDLAAGAALAVLVAAAGRAAAGGLNPAED